MVELHWLDYVGWVGFVGLGLFYWLLGSGKVLTAYVFSIVGASAWLAVGVATKMGYAAELPSLILMESMIILMNIRGIWKWRSAKRKNTNL